jgi:hypothetical protein
MQEHTDFAAWRRDGMLVKDLDALTEGDVIGEPAAGVTVTHALGCVYELCEGAC